MVANIDAIMAGAIMVDTTIAITLLDKIFCQGNISVKERMVIKDI